MITPLNNNVLVEIINEYEGLVGDTTENVQKGIVRGAHLIPDHLTASTGYLINNVEEYAKSLAELTDKVVYWQEYADSGSKFKQDGKEYVLIPFYRIIGYEKGIEDASKK